MKKRYFIIILLLMCFIEVEAKNINLSFTETKDIANNYITNSSKHELYLINSEILPFGFNSKNEITKNEKFLKGGLLNLQEYNISRYKNQTYLRTGINYWTMTNSGDKYYVIEEVNEKLYSIEDLSKHKARITEYVKKDTRVSGSGTYKDPWKFNKLNTIIFVSTDETKGSVYPKKSYVFDNGNLAIAVKAENGYEYASNTCNIETASNNGINIYNIQEDMFCEVTFKEKTYTLTYDNNGGSGCTSKQIIYGEIYGDLCTPVRNGYTFKGWYTSLNGGTQVNASTTTTGDATIYAHWTPNKYRLTYNNNGGSGCGSKNVIFGEKYGDLCTPVRNGYTFTGWYTSLNGGTQVNASTTTTGDATIYAHWTPNKYRLTYNNNGGSGCTSKQIIYGKKYGDLCTPVRNGYTFTGWYTSLNGVTQVSASTTTTGDATIYAHWTAKKYTLTYDNNGGSGCTSKDITYASAYGTLCEPSKIGYTFTGWYTSLNGGTQVTASTTTTGDATIYAHWTAKKYTLTYDNNGGSGCTSKQIIYGKKYGDLCTPLKSGYTFTGWYTQESGGTKITKDTIVYDKPTLKIYAQWVSKKITCNTLDGKVKCKNLTYSSDYVLEYDGECEFICDDIIKGDWRIKFKSSGNLTTTLPMNIDLFVVGGGGGGSGIGGGGGGYTKYYPNLNVDANSYEIRVGSGGSKGSNGGISYFGSSTTYYSDGGKAPTSSSAGAGGSGGGGNGCFFDTWNDGEICTRCGSTSFGSGGRFGNNGNSGGSNSSCKGVPGGTGQDSSTCEFAQGTTESCLTGVDEYSSGGWSKTNKIDNSGNGGYQSTAGSSGIVIMRNARLITVNGEEIGTYDGGYEVIQEDENNWKVKFVSNGTLSLEKNINVDIFVVGGGGGGSSTDCSAGPGFYCQRGGGGGGGYTVTYSNQNISSGTYKIVIGKGGSVDSDGGTSYFGSSSTYFAKGGKHGTSSKGGDGGSGGASATCCGANNESTNYYAIWTSGGTNGSNGGSCSSNCAYYGGSSGGTGQGYTTCEFKEENSLGCNSGGLPYSAGSATGSKNNIINSGNGGGLASSGSSGIVIIRNKRQIK